jgi:hypothetical protein
LKRQRRRVVQAGDHQQPIAERLEWTEERRELEPGAIGSGSPLVHDRAVRHVDDAETSFGSRRAIPHRGERGHHTVEQRKGDRGAESAQDRPTRECLSGDDHVFADLI